MHPVSVLTLGIFLAGYITARWDLVTRLYELAIFAWDHGVITRATKGFLILSVFFVTLLLPLERIANREVELVGSASTPHIAMIPTPNANLQYPRLPHAGISAREQLRRRGSF